MDIFSKEGQKVMVTEETATYGYEYQQLRVKKYLKIGEVYTVDHTDVGNFHTDVYLKEVPDLPFNSVNFINI